MAAENTAIARQYEAGTILFREREPGDRMYVIRSGRVKIYRRTEDQELVLAFLGPGDFLGEMALLEGLPRSASAMVVEPSVLVEVDHATFESMIRRNIEIAVRIMRKLAGRVRSLDQRLERMAVDSAQVRALEVLRWLLPQGIIDEGWIRVRGVAPHLNIAAQAGISPAQAESVISKLQRARVLKFDQEDILIAEKNVLDNYASYLALKREYDPLENQDSSTEKSEQRQALRRLMSVLQLSPEQIESQQKTMQTKYHRYMQLKQRFGAIDEA